MMERRGGASKQQARAGVLSKDEPSVLPYAPGSIKLNQPNSLRTFDLSVEITRRELDHRAGGAVERRGLRKKRQHQARRSSSKRCRCCCPPPWPTRRHHHHHCFGCVNYVMINVKLHFVWLWVGEGTRGALYFFANGRRRGVTGVSLRDDQKKPTTHALCNKRAANPCRYHNNNSINFDISWVEPRFTRLFVKRQKRRGTSSVQARKNNPLAAPIRRADGRNEYEPIHRRHVVRHGGAAGRRRDCGGAALARGRRVARRLGCAAPHPRAPRAVVSSLLCFDLGVVCGWAAWLSVSIG